MSDCHNCGHGDQWHLIECRWVTYKADYPVPGVPCECSGFVPAAPEASVTDTIENVQRAEIETRQQHREIADQIREDVIADFMRFGVDRLRAMHYFDVAYPWIVGAYVAGRDAAQRLEAK